jgi:hypothetical protein
MKLRKAKGSKQVVEYGSRLAFVNALQEGFPDLLTALGHEVYQPFERQ